MLELAIVIPIFGLAVFYLTRRYAGTVKQAGRQEGGCGGNCGCCQSAAGNCEQGCGSAPSPNNTLEKSK